MNASIKLQAAQPPLLRPTPCGNAPPADGLGLLPIDIRHADEIDLRQAGQNPGMFLAQVPDSDYGYPQAGHQNLRQSVASGWWPVARKE